MSTQQTFELSRDYIYDKIQMPYPCVEVHEPSDALALVILGLPVGDLSVICFVNDAMREIRKVQKSALVLNVLRKVSRVTYHKSATEHFEIKSGKDSVEVFC